MKKKKLSLILVSAFLVICLMISSYQIFAGERKSNNKNIWVEKGKNTKIECNYKNKNNKHKKHGKHGKDKKHIKPKITPTVIPTASNTETPTSTPTATPTTKPTATPSSPVVCKIDKNTQLYNLAWSNTGKFSKTNVPSVGNNSIVELDCDDDKSMVDKYNQQGHMVAGYISVGSWEDWRTDKSNFPASVFGEAYDGWDGETWFIVSKWKELIPGMTNRMKKLKEKGFKLVEFDNIEFETGSKKDMIDYALELAKVAKANSLLPIFKNGAELIEQDSRIKDAYSGFIIEEAFEYNETNSFAGTSNKPTWFFEYKTVNKSMIQSWMTNVWFDTSSGWQKMK